MTDALTVELVDDLLGELPADDPLAVEARAVAAAREVGAAGLRGAKDLCDELAGRPDRRAHALLAGFEAFAASPLDGVATQARPRALGDPALAQRVGTATVEAAWRARGEEGEALIAALARPGDERQAPVLVMLAGDGLPFEGAILDPVAPDEAAARLPHLAAELAAGEAEPIPPDALGERVRTAADELAVSRLGGPTGLAIAVALIARATLGDARTVAAVAPEPPAVGDLRPGNEHALATEIEAVVAELAVIGQGTGRDLGEEGSTAVAELLAWKAARDRRLDRWRVKDLDAFLLDFAPGYLDVEPDVVTVSISLYLEWLSARDRLRGDDAGVLRERIAVLAPRYAERAADPARFGPAAALVAQMEREGVDTSDASAVEAWMEAFNTRPFAERDAIIGPSLSARRQAAGPKRPDARRATRKRQRSARRSNRRR